jgi:hypothetical protein
LRRLVTSTSVPLSGFDPLSGFLACSSSATVFHAATVPGIPPFRVFPSLEIAYPSRGSLASLQLSTDVLKRTTLDLLPLVSPTSTLSRSCLVPPTAMGFLFTRLTCFPVALDLMPRNRFIPPALSTSKLHSLLRVRSRLDWVSPHLPAATLLGFCPSRAFSSHASDSRPVQTRGPEHEIMPYGSRLEGPRPLVPGEVVPIPGGFSSASRRFPASLRAWSAPPLDGVSFSLDLRTPGKPFAPGLRSF